MKEKSIVTRKATMSTAKKLDRKAPVKVAKTIMPRIAANHNETLSIQ
jgi:hypothetical protein